MRRGAHVVIVARDAKRSQKTIEDLKALASPEQKIFAVSADLSSRAASERALTNACELVGQVPDYVFLCAGFSKPQLFIDASADDLQSVSRVDARAKLVLTDRASTGRTGCRHGRRTL